MEPQVREYPANKPLNNEPSLASYGQITERALHVAMAQRQDLFEIDEMGLSFSGIRVPAELLAVLKKSMDWDEVVGKLQGDLAMNRANLEETERALADAVGAS